MRGTRLAGLLTAAILLSGCIVDRSEGPRDAPEDEYSGGATDCVSGQGRFFLDSQDESSWVGDRFYAIDRQGRLWGFHAGFPITGGNVTAEYARLANLTQDEAERMFANLSIPRPGVGYNLSAAYVAPLPQGVFTTLCAQVNEGWYDLERFYPHPDCYDANTWTITVATARGVHTAGAYCGAGPDTFDRFVDNLWGAIVDVEESAGVLA